MLQKAKDSALAKVVQMIANHFFEDIGKVLELRIDSQEKKILLQLLLQGESEPVSVAIHKYQIVQIDQDYFFIVDDITITKEWMDTLAKKYFLHKKFAIPSAYAKYLNKII